MALPNLERAFPRPHEAAASPAAPASMAEATSFDIFLDPVQVERP
jgi:hypothetical protein